MRIRSILIERYVALRDRRLDMGDGLTVVHGPNESGKTTTMEFIRRGLVPNSKRNEYPTTDSKDSGRIVVEDDGNDMTIEIRNKKPNVRPGCVESLKADTYRSIYAMTPSELVDPKTMSSSDIRSKFISTPGGDNMPAVMNWIEKEYSDSLGSKTNSPSVYNEADKKVKELTSTLSEQTATRNGFSNLQAERQSLLEEKRRLEETNATILEKKKDRDNHRNNKRNYERLKELSIKKASMGTFKTVTDEDIQKKASLDIDLRKADSDFRDIRSQLDGLNAKMGGLDPDRVMERGDDIKRLKTDKQIYAQRAGSRASARTVPVEPASPAKKAFPIVPVVILIASIAIGAGVYFATESLIGTIAVPAIGAIISAVLLLKGRSAQVNQGLPQTSVPVDDHSDWLDQYDSELKNTMMYLGLTQSNVMSDVERLSDAYDSASDIFKKRGEMSRSELQLTKTGNARLMFLQAYGGEEGFERSKRLTKESADIEKEVASLRDFISGCGLDPDHPEYEEFEDPDMTELNQINMRIGALDQKIESIMKANDVESTQTELDRQESIRDDALRSAAEAVLARYIADEACKRISEDVQPGVCETADRYLSLMTGSRYRLDRDPLTEDLSIVSDDGRKRSLEECSSGLTAQFMLSMKMAIAKEMSGGCIPMILDDVLLTFDTERKRGAIQALQEISSEMQVILFTCDDQTRDFATESGAKVIEMEV